jgi:hypothetical protein
MRAARNVLRVAALTCNGGFSCGKILLPAGTIRCDTAGQGMSTEERKHFVRLAKVAHANAHQAESLICARIHPFSKG